ncbi:asparagine synthase (glutamine-hydrolysing) [Pilibacter termitis]|uniref:asparagine synthase (glutamine-hydrolyzing) n=1 Tax=Pilibacter termitis TaxID=263852 RepID=A0A1T4QQB6_9ENTE|nr:asparagine synthase B [Pilibacter termitis]SKA05807.1 asparagine synthase (glutamine-hydrolysing) [Pilibacter termitis]
MCGYVFSSTDKLSIEKWKEGFNNIQHRGPDDAQFIQEGGMLFGFARLSIMDLSTNGSQPFQLNGKIAMCNGEIYNFEELKAFLKEKGYEFHSESDCEVLLPLFEELGMKAMSRMLDAEFSLVIADTKTGDLYAARDPFGIRPLFYGYTTADPLKIAFASEAKALMPFCQEVHPFPPGHYYANGSFVQFNDIGNTKQMIELPVEEIAQGIQEKLTRGIIKRLHADAPMGFLLSGGLDSSLVCAIAQKELPTPIQTFAIGMESDPIDLKYAKEVADFIKSEHTEVIMTKEDVLGALREVIYHLETYDITTIRASVGMYLICKYIHENTDLKVLLTGEVSDEMFGYKYTDFAPNAREFQREAQKRVRELYMYDVLRADRCLAAHSLEARVPFADLDFANFVMSINPARKMNVYGQGKYLLRKAFENSNILPNSILYREKAAFSDAVGHSLVDYLKEYAEERYTDEDVANAHEKYKYATPFTRESLLYREIFEEFYPNQAHWVKDFWMPNKEWVGEEVNDPSARVLSNYGDSGK